MTLRVHYFVFAAMILCLEAYICKAGDDQTRPLKEAIEAFNQEGAKDPIGRSESPLTEDEVVAAIRRWDRLKLPVIDQVHKDEVYAVFDRIATSRTLPKNAKLDVTRSWVTAKYEITGWSISVDVTTSSTTGFKYPIRDRVISSRPIDEK